MSDRVEQVAKAIYDEAREDEIVNGCVLFNSWEDSTEDGKKQAFKLATAAISATQEVWTTEPPTVPGWYWRKTPSGKVSVVEIKMICGELSENRSGAPVYAIISEWSSGPITPPPAPVGDDTKGG